MSERDIGQEILDGIREIKAFKGGQGNLRTRTLKEPAPPQIIRARLSYRKQLLPAYWVSVYEPSRIGNRAGANRVDPRRLYCELQNKNLMCSLD
jgi:hypothetical protein